MFNIMLKDNIKARQQDSDGTYSRKVTNDAYLSSQQYFYNEAYENAQKSLALPPEHKALKAITNLKGFISRFIP